MFTDIKNIVYRPSECMTSKYSIGIIETNADSSFLFHHFLSYFLKEKCSVVFLSFCQSFNHFNSVGNKIGNNLTKERDLNNFLFIDGLKGLAHAVNSESLKGDNPWSSCMQNNGKMDVKGLYKIIKQVINKLTSDSDKNVVFIIDNLSMLVDIGVHAEDVMALVHYLNNYVTKDIEGSFVFGVNNDLGEQDEDADHLKKFIQHTVNMSLEVKGLETGYCKDVHGQLEVRWYNTAARETSTTKVSQFKLTDKTCAVFASGMSSAVL